MALKVPKQKTRKKIHYLGNLMWNAQTGSYAGWENTAQFLERRYLHWNNYHKTETTEIVVGCDVGTITKVALKTKSQAVLKALTVHKPPSRLLDNSMSIVDRSHDQLDRFAKTLMCKMVMTGVDTMVSHRTTLQFYKAATTAIQELYDISLKGLQLQDKKVLPPPRVTVNKNNIGRVEDAILSAYKHDQSPNNPYHILKNADFYSVSFDGTSEYVKAVNASFFRVATSNGDIHTAPAELKEVHGSFNGEALANILLDVLGDMKSMENSAFDSVSSLLDDLIKAKENSVQRKVSVQPEVEVAALTREVLRLSQLGDLEYIPVLCSRQNYLKHMV